MKRLWMHKWLVVIGAAVIFLSVGAAAFAATYGGTVSSGSDSAATMVAQNAAGPGAGAALAQRSAVERKQAMRERVAERLERQKARLERLRDDMSAADQNKLDELVERIEDQQAELKKARQELAATLKQLRELVKKYLPASDSTN
jgi:parvulin-like peptidyl-prolyl isomerase